MNESLNERKSLGDDTIGLLPAAGKGLRLSLPYPKELYPLIVDKRYKPISQFVLDNLVTAGIRHVAVVINETKHQLIGYFGGGHRFGAQISYVVQEPSVSKNESTSPGLADALDSGYHLTRGKTVFFGMPDTIMEPKNVFDYLRSAAGQNDDLALGLFPTARPEKFGMVRLGEGDSVIEIVDKPKQTTLEYMWGCMSWGPRFTEHLHQCVQEAGMSDFAKIMNQAIGQGFRVRGVRIPEGSFRDLGTYDEILELDPTLLLRSGNTES